MPTQGAFAAVEFEQPLPVVYRWAIYLQVGVTPRRLELQLNFEIPKLLSCPTYSGQMTSVTYGLYIRVPLIRCESPLLAFGIRQVVNISIHHLADARAPSLCYDEDGGAYLVIGGGKQ